MLMCRYVDCNVVYEVVGSEQLRPDSSLKRTGLVEMRPAHMRDEAGRQQDTVGRSAGGHDRPSRSRHLAPASPADDSRLRRWSSALLALCRHGLACSGP